MTPTSHKNRRPALSTTSHKMNSVKQMDSDASRMDSEEKSDKSMAARTLET